MASTKITGQLYRIDPTKEENGYKTRNFVLFVQNDRNPQYSDYLSMELRGDKCALLDMYQNGQMVEVSLDIRGRKYEKKDGSGEGYFTSLSCYAISLYGAMPQQNPAQYASAPPAQYANAAPIYGAESVNYPPTSAAAVARGEKPVIGQENKQGDLPF